MSRPSVVALGGGHGLATTLSAVCRYAGQVTAVVSVADDGGSSGRLREIWDGPAPGDIRHCLVSLAGSVQGDAGAAEAVRTWAKAFDYRFEAGELAGHSLGNLVLVALTETMGDFVAATATVGDLLGVGARVLPATAVPVSLMAEMGGLEVAGQVRISHTPSPVRRVWLEPPAPPALPEALEAIAGADQVVIGPGSLFTSILATCAVPGVRQALAERRGGRVYVCNLDHQETETVGLDADAHLAALAAHGVVVDMVLCDPATTVGEPSAEGLSVLEGHPSLMRAALAQANGHSHDPARLAEALARACPGE